MTLKAFDISNWQRGIDAASLPADIIIVKATEGLNFVDQTAAPFYESAKKAGKLLGFYHFARNNDPVKEAQFFHKHTSNWSKEAVPILDLEDTGISSWSSYATRFVDEYHRLTGVWCMLYTSAGYLHKIATAGLEKKCALWCAGYPYAASGWRQDVAIPYNISPWKVATGWQFTSSFAVQGRKIDASFFYVDAKGWKAIATGGKATSSTPSTPAKPATSTGKKSVAELAKEVIAGKWGNGQDRRVKLGKAGYSYDAVQAEVNRQLGAGTNPAQPKRTHIVSAGETLSGIAAKYGTTVSALVKANNIQNPNLIYPNQQIRIP